MNRSVRRLILDSLRYWVSEMHVDGFRFDLASILSRDQHGRPMASPPILWDIESDPVLANVKLIAEAWDAAGLYQVGSFVGDSWKEWNGRFRDDVRAFLKGDNGTSVRVAYRLTGQPGYLSSDEEREAGAEHQFRNLPRRVHAQRPGLVQRQAQRGERRRKPRRSDYNLSWNCGVEGPTDDPEVERLRNRQVKNFLTLTLLAIGHADAADGRRSATHPGRQQQRLLPGQRDHLVRLEPGREARGYPSLCQGSSSRFA